MESTFCHFTTTFIRFYNDFHSGFVSTFGEDGQGVNNYETFLLTFGLSKAGKSTLLARLKSDMTSTEFYKIINTPYRFGEGPRIVEVENIKIGISASSTTIVPRAYPLPRNFCVCDMPGFKDINENNRIFINVLQKCMLTRLGRGKFLVVVNMDVIVNDKGLAVLREDYAKSIRELVQERYKEALLRTFFVITHADKHPGITSCNVRDKVLQGAEEADYDDPTGALFLRRLAKHHIIVNYNEVTPAVVSEGINRMVSLAKMDAGDRDLEWTIDKLSASENDLNKRCVAEIQSLQEMGKDIGQQILEIGGHIQEFRIAATDRFSIIKTNVERIATWNNDLSTRLADLKREKDKAPEIIAQIEREIELLQYQLRQQEEIVMVYEEQTKELCQYPVKIVESHNTASYFGSGYYEIKTTLHIKADRPAKVLILEHPTNVLGSSYGSLLQSESLSEAEWQALDSMKGEYVLHNPLANINLPDIVCNNDSTKVTLQLTVNKPFVAFICYRIPFKRTQMFKTLNAKHYRVKARLEEVISEKLNQLRGLKEDVPKRDELVRNLERQQMDSRNNAMEETQALLNLRNQLTTEYQSYRDSLLALSQKCLGVNGSEAVANLRTITHIFSTNHIEFNWGASLEAQIQVLNETAISINATVSEFRRWHEDSFMLKIDDLARILQVVVS